MRDTYKLPVNSYAIPVLRTRFEISCVCYFIACMADKQPRQHDKKTINLVLIAAFPLNTTMKKVNLLKLFIFPFVLQREHG